MSNETETISASLGNATPPDLQETFNGGPPLIPTHITDPDALGFSTPPHHCPRNHLHSPSHGTTITTPCKISPLASCDSSQQHSNLNQLRAGAHSDYGTITINIGDLMSCWTDNRWRSTLHSVANPAQHDPASRRQSIAYFHQPNWDAVIACLTDTQPLYAAVTSGPYLMSKFKATV